MTKTFFPDDSLVEFVSATYGDLAHPIDTWYKVSIGNEIWEESSPLVIKVQMQYKKTGLQGRRSPSYPFGTDDYERVHRAIQRLIDKKHAMIAKKDA